MLDSHSKIVVPPECGLIEWLYDSYQNWTYPDDLESFLDDLYSARKFETWNVPEERIRDEINRKKPQTYQEVCRVVYFTYAKTIDKEPEIWGDKNNYYIRRIDKLNKIYPHAKYIHLVRDGRDVSVSYRQIHDSDIKSRYKPDLPYAVDEIATEWNHNLSNIKQFFDSLPPSRHITVRYEDLLSRNQETLIKLTDFLGILFEPEMKKYHVRNKNLSIEPEETLEWKKKTVQDIDTSRIGRYRDHLSTEEIRQFESVAGPHLEHLGYNQGAGNE